MVRGSTPDRVRQAVIFTALMTALVLPWVAVRSASAAQSDSPHAQCGADPLFWKWEVDGSSIEASTPPGSGALSALIDEDGFHWGNNVGESHTFVRIVVKAGLSGESAVYDAPGLPNPVPLPGSVSHVKFCFGDPPPSSTSTTTTTLVPVPPPSSTSTTTTAGVVVNPTGGFQANAAIVITKVVDSPILGEDGVAVFTITVTNPGPVDLVDVVVTDAVAVSADPASTCGRTIGDLAAGAAMSYDCTVNFGEVSAPFDNTVTATGTDDLGTTVEAQDSVTVFPAVLATTVTTSAVLGQALPSTGIDSDRIAFVGGLLLAVGLLLVALTTAALRSQRSGPR